MGIIAQAEEDRLLTHLVDGLGLDGCHRNLLLLSVRQQNAEATSECRFPNLMVIPQ